MISAALVAFLTVPLGIEPARTVDPRPAAVASPTSEPHKELSPAVLERLEKLSKMSGDERAQALADVPPERREKIEKGLVLLDALTPEQRVQWFNRYRNFQGLPPGQKTEVRKIVRDLQTLPVSRRKLVRDELDTYRHMPMDAREARMRSPDFRNKFIPEEREILHHAAALLSEPVPAAPIKR